jgi:molecular chaperone DnaK (HSP70)
MQVSNDSISSKSKHNIHNIDTLLDANSSIENDYIKSLDNNEIKPDEEDNNVVKNMISDKNVYQQQIYNFYKMIKSNQNNIEELDKQIYKLCVHDWIRDEAACYDDRCKHICSKCSLYRSPHLYR